MWLLERLRGLGIRGGRVLDQGSFFGNFSLALARLGFEVTACDYYSQARGALDPWCSLLRKNGIEVIDAGSTESSLPVPAESFDLVISMAVIEHIPNSPKQHLLELHRALRPRGVIVVETPNLAYQAKREQLAQGRSIMAALEAHFEAVAPFSGHHREYVAEEVEWMLNRIGFTELNTEYFDFSYRSLPQLDEEVLRQVAFRKEDPTRQELLMTVGRKAQ